MKSGKRAQATHKRQHFVPKSYLASWTDPGTPSGQEPYVHLLTKDGSGYRRKAPAKIFRETDLYTIKMAGGLRDLTLERGLSQLENSFMRVVREFIVPRRPLPTIPRLKLMLFVAALHARTLKMRDHHSAQWKRLLNIVERGAPEDGRIEWLDGTSDSEAPSYIHVDDIRELVENPMPTTVLSWSWAAIALAESKRLLSPDRLRLAGFPDGPAKPTKSSLDEWRKVPT